MKIAFDSETFCQQSYGGISRYFARLVEQFILMKQDVGIFAPLHRNNYINRLPPGIVHGFRLRSYMPKGSRMMISLNRYVSMPLIKSWKPDVVHETYYTKSFLSPKLCPSIVTIHDMIFELFPGDFPSRFYTSQLKKHAIERAKHIICISENTRRDLITIYNTNPNKISVVHHGFNKFNVYNNKEINLNLHNKPYLLYVGSRSIYKNYLGFIRSVSYSKKLKKDFNIIAFGGGKFDSSELSQMKKLGFLPDQIIQLSGDDNILAFLYKKAAAFVYPSLYEGFGLPPLEAMANNCPVISSNTSSMPEVIGDAGEYFNPQIVEEIALAIEKVVYSPIRSQELIEKGQKRLTQYSWKDCAEKTLDIYKSIV